MAIFNTGLTGSLIEVARTRLKRHLITRSYGPLTSFSDAAVIGQMLKSTDVYTPTTSPLAALVVIDILSPSIALRKGDTHTLAVLDMKQRLADMRSTGVI